MLKPSADIAGSIIVIVSLPIVLVRTSRADFDFRGFDTVTP